MNFSKFTFLLVTLSLGLSLATGCANTSSDNVKTSGFYATYEVNGNNGASGGTAVCKATFQVGGVTGTYLSLDSGDTVTCNGAPMTKNEFLGLITYTATVAYAANTTYTLVLTRAGEAPYSSAVVLPTEIVGFSPSNNFTHPKGTALNTTWTPSVNGSDNFSVTLSFNNNTASRSVLHSDSGPENGALSFTAGETDLNPTAVGNYLGSLRYLRIRTGTMASGLAGYIQGSQEQIVSLTIQ